MYRTHMGEQSVPDKQNRSPNRHGYYLLRQHIFGHPTRKTKKYVGALLWFRGTYFAEQKLIYSQINAGQSKCNLVLVKSTNNVNCTL